MLAERLYQTRRCGGADSLDRAGGQVPQDGVCRFGRGTLERFRLKLLAEAWVMNPGANDAQLFPATDPGEGADHRDQLLPCFQLQDFIPVILIAKDDFFHRAGQFQQLFFLHIPILGCVCS